MSQTHRAPIDQVDDDESVTYRDRVTKVIKESTVLDIVFCLCMYGVFLAWIMRDEWTKIESA